MKEERVQKLIANYGKYSRREADALIDKGRVKVNGEVIIAGTKATVNDKIEIDGKPIKFNLKHEYYLLNKPKGYICAREDQMGRSAISLIDNYKERNLFTIGRLDVNTTGLLIITTDGDLSNKVASPGSKVRKTYLAWIDGPVSNDVIRNMREGVEIDGGYVTKPIKKIKVINNEPGKVLVKMTLTEGKKNQIKRMFEAFDRKVVNLKRVQIEQFNLDKIATGEYRKISKSEIYNGLGIELPD